MSDEAVRDSVHDETHGSLRTDLIGFLLAVVLGIPFWLVMTGVPNSRLATALAIARMPRSAPGGAQRNVNNSLNDSQSY